MPYEAKTKTVFVDILAPVLSVYGPRGATLTGNVGACNDQPDCEEKFASGESVEVTELAKDAVR